MCLLATLCLVLASSIAGTAQPRPKNPLRLRTPTTRFEVSFGSQGSANAFVHPIPNVGRNVGLMLRVLPEFDVAGQLCCWEVSLTREDAGDTNLLAPRQNWHGLQPFMLVARDLQNGPSRASFGERRVISTSVGIDVVVVIRDAQIVTSSSTGDPLFRALGIELIVVQEQGALPNR